MQDYDFHSDGIIGTLEKLKADFNAKKVEIEEATKDDKGAAVTKILADGEKGAHSYDKFACFCKDTGARLEPHVRRPLQGLLRLLQGPARHALPLHWRPQGGHAV